MNIEAQGDGAYEIETDSYDGPKILTLTISRAEELSDGRLADDEATAGATLQYLLTHQDAADLPEFIYLTDVVAAYDDAIASIIEIVEQGEQQA